ncbi:MAG: tetratricopeptide repeat protein [Bacteroidetes bacterium]|nr:tetratricopeptide repeat protein [Bacteroidota bacterium]
MVNNILMSSSRIYLQCFFVWLSLCLSIPGKSNVQHQQADSLNLAAQKAFRQNLALSFHLAQHAKELSTRDNYDRGKVESICTLGLIQALSKYPISAIDTLTFHLKLVPENNTQARFALEATLAQCWYYRGFYDSSQYYFNRAISKFTTETDLPQYGLFYLFGARLYLKVGAMGKALHCYDVATKVWQLSRKKEKGVQWDVLGSIYYAQRLYDKALECFRQSVRQLLKEKNVLESINPLIHLGNTFYLKMEDDSAKWYYTQALETAQQVGDSLSTAILNSNLSRLALESKNPSLALQYALRAADVLSGEQYISSEAGNEQQIGDIYGELNDIPSAIKHVQNALRLARISGNQTIVRDCYKSLSEFYAWIHKPEIAYENLLAAYRIKDSTQPAMFGRQLAEMEVKYATERKENEIQILKQNQQIATLKISEQKSKMSNQRFMLFALIALLIGGITSLYFYLSKRKLIEGAKQKEAARKAIEEERIRLAKDIHDELGSGLSKIRFLSELVSAPKDNSSNLNTTLHSISITAHNLVDNMKDLIWAMNPSNSTLDNLIARIREYATDYLEDTPIKLTWQLPDYIPKHPITKEFSRNIFMIVKEALQNIVKHAEANSVHILLQIQPKFILSISDNGIGYDKQSIKYGNGLRNMDNRALFVGATFTVESQKSRGTTILISCRTLPLS